MFHFVGVFCYFKKKSRGAKKKKRKKVSTTIFLFMFFFCLAWIFTSFFVVAICIIKAKIIPKKPPTRSQTTFRLFLRESGNQQLHMRTDYNLTRVFWIFLLWLNIMCVFCCTIKMCVQLKCILFCFFLVLGRLWAAAAAAVD